MINELINMVKPEKFGHLQLVYHFTIPLIPSYLLKVTQFLRKISPYEFLVMTEKNICFFVIKHFRFIFFYVKIASQFHSFLYI